MELRQLGRTGLRVSHLGLGTLTWSRDTDEHEAREQLRDFVDAGGTLLLFWSEYGGSGTHTALRVARLEPGSPEWSPAETLTDALGQGRAAQGGAEAGAAVGDGRHARALGSMRR